MSGVNQTPGCGVTDYANENDTPEKMAGLGDVAYFNGKKHIFVQAHTVCLNDVITAGSVLYHTASEHVVTNVVAQSATTGVGSYAGIAPALTVSVPESSTASGKNFFWMQCPGEGFATVNTNGDDDIAAGDTIVASGDGVCDSDATPDMNAFIGTAMAADNDTANTVLVRLR